MEINYQETDRRKDEAFAKVCRSLGFGDDQISKINDENLLRVSFDGQILRLNTPAGNDGVSYETSWIEKEFIWKLSGAKEKKDKKYLIGLGPDGFPRHAYLCTQEYEEVKILVGDVGVPNTSTNDSETLQWVISLDVQNRGKLSRNPRLSRFINRTDVLLKQKESIIKSLEALKVKEEQKKEEIITDIPLKDVPSYQLIVEDKTKMDPGTYFKLTSHLLVWLHGKGISLTDHDSVTRVLRENNMLVKGKRAAYQVDIGNGRVFPTTLEEDASLVTFTPTDVELPELDPDSNIEFGVPQGSYGYTSWLTQILDDEPDHFPIFRSTDRQSNQVFIPEEDFYELLKRVSNKN